MNQFPNPEETDKEGLLCVGGELTEDLLIEAYSRGIFPWPQEGLPILWFSPPRRGILFFENFKIPSSCKKELLKSNYKLSMNKGFDRVIDECAKAKRKKQSGTWILDNMKQAYLNLHRKGIAQSIECWEGDELVGGLYGVFLQGVFSGESMFFKKSASSKACLIFLVQHLQELGVRWMDIQMVTPVLKLFGGEYMPRKKFLQLLKDSQSKKMEWKNAKLKSAKELWE